MFNHQVATRQGNRWQLPASSWRRWKSPANPRASTWR
jgi:hypothetical protein